MNNYESVFARKSVRRYKKDEELAPDIMEQIEAYLKEEKSLFGGIETAYRIIRPEDHAIKKTAVATVHAPYYLALYSEEHPKAYMNAGYILEQAALFFCTLGLGTCFIGANILKRSWQSWNGKRFAAILAFGPARESPVRKAVEARRISMEDLCIFKEVPRQWMKQLLEAARMAPSSMNSQPWRFVVYDNRIHIFSKKKGGDKPDRLEEINFGIMFANMMVVAEELWLDVDLIRLDGISQKSVPNNRYILSAILRP